jgi:hypothetical protein
MDDDNLWLVFQDMRSTGYRELVASSYSYEAMHFRLEQFKAQFPDREWSLCTSREWNQLQQVPVVYIGEDTFT